MNFRHRSRFSSLFLSWKKKRKNEIIWSSLQRRHNTWSKRFIQGSGGWEEGGVAAERNSKEDGFVRTAIFPIYRFPMLQIFRPLDWFLEPLLFHSWTYPVSILYLSPSFFFFPSFLSRQIFVSVKRFYRLHVTRNVSNDCFPISAEFCIILTNFSPYDITNRERFLFIYKNICIYIKYKILSISKIIVFIINK